MLGIFRYAWVVLTSDLWSGKLWASARSKPYLRCSLKQSGEKVNFETDYNQKLVEMLLDLGYEGNDPQDLVDQYVVYCNFFTLKDHARRFLVNLSAQEEEGDDGE